MAMKAKMGVVGGGRMGAGIAQVLAVAGYEVVVVEATEQAASQARERIAAGLARAKDHGALDTDPAKVLAMVTLSADVSELAGETVLVVEAVPEVLTAKLEVLGRVEPLVMDSCIIATNTSSLPVSQLATVLERPERFVGMHFFNPVPPSLLVEIVVAEHTSPSTLDRAVEWVRELGKSEIVVKDSPGFATSRLGVLLGLEAIRMLEEGVADAEAIDKAMELGYRHPMGPLRSTDLVGLDVRLAIAKYLSDALGERFNPPQLLVDKVLRGELGRKTGKGFYTWS